MAVQDHASFLRNEISDAMDQLENYVRTRMRGQVGDLRLVVADCGIVLRGYAHSYYAKALAQHTLISATQAPFVANEIEVRQTFQKAGSNS